MTRIGPLQERREKRLPVMMVDPGKYAFEPIMEQKSAEVFRPLERPASGDRSSSAILWGYADDCLMSSTMPSKLATR